MAIKDIFKVSRKTFLSPTAWLGLNQLRAYTREVTEILKAAYAPAKPRREETFENAMKRQHLTEVDLVRIASRYRWYSALFIVLSFLTFIVSFYYLFHHETISGWILCWAVIIILLGQAFRYSFWRFQIVHRKLGCTIKEWWNGKLDDAGA